MYAIEINNLIKEYDNGIRAINGLNLTVNSGEIFPLLGPNGAGKSSLINILTTFYKPTSGEVKILGKNLCKNPGHIRSNIACVSQKISVDNHLSLMENMMFQSRTYKVPQSLAIERINSLIKTFDLSKYIDYPVSSYSGGVKRRLDIAMNLVSSPKILFLDEPTVGMDVQSRKSMWEMLIKTCKEHKTTIFLTTHYLEEADALSDNICIVKNGKNLIQDTPQNLRNYIQQNMIKIVFSNNSEAEKYKPKLQTMNCIYFSNLNKNILTLSVNDNASALKTINKFLLETSALFTKIEIVEPSLEDVFLALTNSKKINMEEMPC